MKNQISTIIVINQYKAHMQGYYARKTARAIWYVKETYLIECFFIFLS